MTQYLEDFLPPIQNAGLNTQENVSITGTLASGSQTITGSNSATGAVLAYSGTAVPAAGAGNVGVTFSATANLGLFCGTGAPTVSAAKGSLYVRTDATTTTTRLYINTDGGTTWTTFTTAA
jgi:hypothetical protein